MREHSDSQDLPVSVGLIQERIFLVRGRKVMVDRDLADLYRVPVKRLNEQVRRNRNRFPPDFLFRLTSDEVRALRSQIATLKPPGRGQHRKFLPYAFTEQGVAMLSSVLRSPCAVQVNISIMRAFVRMREILTNHPDFAQKLDAMEKKYDAQFRVIFKAIRELMQDEPVGSQPRIGFKS